MQIREIHITELYQMVNQNNPKIHKLNDLIDSIQRYGFWGVVTVNNDVIVAGNGRTKALMNLYTLGESVANLPDWKIPCVISDIPQDELYNFVVDDNLTGMVTNGLAQLNNAQLVTNLSGDNLPISISQNDYDFLKKVFNNDFSDKPANEVEKPKEQKHKPLKITLNCQTQELLDDIKSQLTELFFDYIEAGELKIK